MWGKCRASGKQGALPIIIVCRTVPAAKTSLFETAHSLAHLHGHHPYPPHSHLPLWALDYKCSVYAQCVGGNGFGLLEQEPMLPGDNALQRQCSDGDIARLRELRSADPTDLTTFDKNCKARYITNHSHGPMQDKYNMKQLIKEWSIDLGML